MGHYHGAVKESNLLPLLKSDIHVLSANVDRFRWGPRLLRGC